MRRRSSVLGATSWSATIMPATRPHSPTASPRPDAWRTRGASSSICTPIPESDRRRSARNLRPTLRHRARARRVRRRATTQPASRIGETAAASLAARSQRALIGPRSNPPIKMGSPGAYDQRTKFTFPSDNSQRRSRRRDLHPQGRRLTICQRLRPQRGM